MYVSLGFLVHEKTIVLIIKGFFTALDTKEFRVPRNSVLCKLEDVAIMSWRRAT